ncbi:MAG: aconitase family protein [Candidatus Sumerlaeota bacterium]|nr:aconitase family protein [Candidatus Sumerlaeota bacterium]
MALNLAQKLIAEHLVAGSLQPGEDIALRADQTLLQDPAGVVACLMFEAIQTPRAQTKLSAIYVDHNVRQSSVEDADAHRYLRTFAAKHGLYYSPPGNGIGHQVHLERFSVPGQTLLGVDPRTPMAGAMGMLALEAEAIDLAMVLAGGPYLTTMPRVLAVHVNGRLRPWVSARDIAWALRGMVPPGAVGCILEYVGAGLDRLPLCQRATLAGMTCDMGARASAFPSDAMTRRFLQAQSREDAWQPLAADPGARYDGDIEIDLAGVEPVILQLTDGASVVKVSQLAGMPIDQVCIGSCVNGSFRDLMVVARALKSQKRRPRVSLVLAPASRQILLNLMANGALSDLLAAGARLTEPACGLCYEGGQAPPSGGVSLQTFSRLPPAGVSPSDSRVYLCSPETAVASAIAGQIADPRSLGKPPSVEFPERFLIDDAALQPPLADGVGAPIVRGPSLRPVPLPEPLPDALELPTLLKVGDRVGEGQILRSRPEIRAPWPDLDAVADSAFQAVDPGFAARARERRAGILVAGGEFGFGVCSQMEALVLARLGVRAVLARSYSPALREGLIGWGIAPLLLLDGDEWGRFHQGDRISLTGLHAALAPGAPPFDIRNRDKRATCRVAHNLSRREGRILLAGGKLRCATLCAADL